MAILKIVCHTNVSDAFVHHVQKSLRSYSFVTGISVRSEVYWKNPSSQEITLEIRTISKVDKTQWENLFSSITEEWFPLSDNTFLELIHPCTTQETEENPKAFFAMITISKEEVSQAKQ